MDHFRIDRLIAAVVVSVFIVVDRWTDPTESTRHNATRRHSRFCISKKKWGLWVFGVFVVFADLLTPEHPAAQLSQPTSQSASDERSTMTLMRLKLLMTITLLVSFGRVSTFHSTWHGIMAQIVNRRLLALRCNRASLQPCCSAAATLRSRTCTERSMEEAREGAAQRRGRLGRLLPALFERGAHIT